MRTEEADLENNCKKSILHSDQKESRDRNIPLARRVKEE